MKRKFEVSSNDDLHFAFFGLLPELRVHVLSFLLLEDLKILRTASKWFKIFIDEKFLIQVLKIDMGGVPILSSLTNAFQNFPNAEGAEITNAMPDEFVEHLPRKLKRLSICASRLLSGTTLAQLPPSLEKLVLSCDKFEKENLKFISNMKIQTLECFFTVDLKYVPRTLRTLIVGFNSFQKISDFDHLPNQLESLIIRLCSLQEAVSMSQKMYLPSSLKYLSLSNCGPSFTEIVVRSLPQQLVELNLAPGKYISNSDVVNFPASLKYLHIGESDLLTGECFSLLPKTLLHLHLPECLKLHQNFGDLPPNLRSLNIANSGISNNQVSLIPRSVKHMNLSYTKVTDAGLANLPPNLLTLTLAGCSITDNGIKALPRTIKNLSLYNVKKITNKMIQYLPDALKVIDLEECTGIEVESASCLFEDMGIWVWYGLNSKKQKIKS